MASGMMATMAGAGVAVPRVRELRRRGSPIPSTFRRGAVKVAAAGGRGATRIHRLIEEEGVVLMPGCYDALTAAVVERSGFSAGFISGYALSASLLGKPDIGLLTSVLALHFLVSALYNLLRCFDSWFLYEQLFGQNGSPPEMAEAARNVCSAAPRIPIIADAGTIVSQKRASVSFPE